MRHLLAFCLLFSAPAFAGQEVTDIDVKSRICSGDSAPTYNLRKELGGSAVTKSITNSQFDDLVVEADVSRTAFDTEANSILGAWWSNLPDTSGDPAKTALYTSFKDIADAD